MGPRDSYYETIVKMAVSNKKGSHSSQQICRKKDVTSKKKLQRMITES